MVEWLSRLSKHKNCDAYLLSGDFIIEVANMKSAMWQATGVRPDILLLDLQTALAVLQMMDKGNRVTPTDPKARVIPKMCDMQIAIFAAKERRVEVLVSASSPEVWKYFGPSDPGIKPEKEDTGK